MEASATIFLQMQCCGVQGAEDYAESAWKIESISRGDNVSKTCCRMKDADDPDAHKNPKPINETLCQDIHMKQNIYRHTKVNTAENVCEGSYKVTLFSIFSAVVFIPNTKQSYAIVLVNGTLSELIAPLVALVGIATNCRELVAILYVKQKNAWMDNERVQD